MGRNPRKQRNVVAPSIRYRAHGLNEADDAQVKEEETKWHFNYDG
jgi:hypothetical protein